jgi:signal peptidase I
VIAVGGQTVDIDYGTNTVYVDGKAIDSKYIRERMVKRGDITLPAKVPKGYVFVMGDNRNDSLDSRYNMIGMVDTRSIVGKAVLRIFPFNEFGLL